MTHDSSRLADLRIGDLFAREPSRFGMRGDSSLWTEMRESFAETPLPDSMWDLRRQLEKSWEAAVGQRLTASSDPLYIPRFNPGHGMSAGNVVPAWWHDTGLLILIDRYEGLTSDTAI